jgi:tight adherence protein B
VADLPGALEDVARSLRSGTSLRVALAEASTAAAGPARRDLGVVVEHVDRGVALGEALDGWAERRPAAEVRLAVAALGLGLDAGFTSARTVDGVAATLRERAAVAGEVATQATQARLSALVIALLPVAFTTWASLTDGRIAGFLFASPAGWACLFGGVTLNAVGAAWMARIMRSVR